MSEVKAFLPQGSQGEKAKALVYILVIVFVLIIVSIVIKKFFGGIDGLLEALHLKDDAATVKNKDDIANYNDTANEPGSPWSPAYWKTAPSDSDVQVAQATGDTTLYTRLMGVADNIYNSVGFLWDDPSEGIGAIKTLANKAELSVVADIMQQKYSVDLWEFLHKHYDTRDQLQALNDIITFVSNLPNY